MKGMEAKNVVLETEFRQLKFQMTTRDEEILLLKSEISKLRTLLHMKYVSNNMERDFVDSDDGPSTRALDRPPTSCQDLADGYYNLNGLYLVQDVRTNKIQAVFCRFLAADNSKNLM